MTLALVLVITAFVAAPAMADGYYYQPDQPDESMCYDTTRNLVMCASIGSDGISSGGLSAPCPEKTCKTCAAVCECEYKKAVDKCDKRLQCLDGASAEHDACLGNCTIDCP